MKITVNSTNYIAAHGKRPAGTGMWAFDFSDGTGRWTTEFVPHPMSITDAKRWAIMFARTIGCNIVQVGS